MPENVVKVLGAEYKLKSNCECGGGGVCGPDIAEFTRWVVEQTISYLMSEEGQAALREQGTEIAITRNRGAPYRDMALPNSAEFIRNQRNGANLPEPNYGGRAVPITEDDGKRYAAMVPQSSAAFIRAQRKGKVH